MLEGKSLYNQGMPFVIIFAGAVLAIFALYRYFLKATPHQIKTLFLSVAAIAIGLGAFFLAVTGRLPAAIAILAVLCPLAISYLKSRRHNAAPAHSDLPASRREAYDVLGLKENASEEDIRAAHLRLMKKVHPDQQGSDWLARKINAARDLLLNG